METQIRQRYKICENEELEEQRCSEYVLTIGSCLAHLAR